MLARIPHKDCERLLPDLESHVRLAEAENRPSILFLKREISRAQPEREWVERDFPDARALVQLFLGDARQLALRVPRQEQESSEHIDKRQRRYEE